MFIILMAIYAVMMPSISEVSRLFVESYLDWNGAWESIKLLHAAIVSAVPSMVYFRVKRMI